MATWIITISVLILAMQVSCRKLDEASMEARHVQWMARHGRVYKDEAEKERRFQIFKSNVEYIESFNEAGNKKPYKLGLNQFADQTIEELKALRNGYKRRRRSPNKTLFRYENVTDVPSSLDWREKGAVTPIKDQGSCGSCWAFTVVASVEGLIKISTGNLTSLSEQDLVDCDTTNSGCHGGDMDTAFQWIADIGGLPAESAYPYTGLDGKCNQSARHVASIGGYEDVPALSEAALLKAVAAQPVTVAIDAGSDDFMLYSGGVFNGSCGTDLDHGVTVVGYGETEEEGTKYWVVKNSWGVSWGELGYIRMLRDFKATEGLCGIAMDPSYPIPAS